MHSCSSCAAPIQKGDKLSKSQCPQDEKERAEMEKVPYASAIGSLMYAQVCTRPDISFVVNALERYLSNLGLNHWKAVKKVMRYLQCDTPKPGGLVDQRQPEKTCVSHIMRPINE